METGAVAISLSAKERVMRARIGALSMHAQGKTNTGPARRAYMARFERGVDPEGRLDPVERARRAALAHRAHMTKLALKSARVRGARNRQPSSTQ